jgi:hypothetical protein
MYESNKAIPSIMLTKVKKFFDVLAFHNKFYIKQILNLY